MAYKYREEIVGKRFLSVRGPGKLKFSKISEWAWRSGIVRAASHKDPKHPELSVLVEFDDTAWKHRQWLRLYQEDAFSLFLVENTLVWTLRRETLFTGPAFDSLYWPSLTFMSLVDKAGLEDSRLQPVEYLVDKELEFVDYATVLQYVEDDVEYQPVSTELEEVQKAIKRWAEYQDGQRILVTTPSVLVGFRVEVYRVEGTTQWYTAVVISYNDATRELILTDDTVLEEHSEDPCLVQMKLIGDGVIESILRGENVGPRRRSCTNQQSHFRYPVFPVHYSTRTRSHYAAATCLLTRLIFPPGCQKTRKRAISSSICNDYFDSRASTSGIAALPNKVSDLICDKKTTHRNGRKASSAVVSKTGCRKRAYSRRRRSRHRRKRVPKSKCTKRSSSSVKIKNHSASTETENLVNNTEIGCILDNSDLQKTCVEESEETSSDKVTEQTCISSKNVDEVTSINEERKFQNAPINEKVENSSFTKDIGNLDKKIEGISNIAVIESTCGKATEREIGGITGGSSTCIESAEIVECTEKSKNKGCAGSSDNKKHDLHHPDTSEEEFVNLSLADCKIHKNRNGSLECANFSEADTFSSETNFSVKSTKSLDQKYKIVTELVNTSCLDSQGTREVNQSPESSFECPEECSGTKSSAVSYASNKPLHFPAVLSNVSAGSSTIVSVVVNSKTAVKEITEAGSKVSEEPTYSPEDTAKNPISIVKIETKENETEKSSDVNTHLLQRLEDCERDTVLSQTKTTVKEINTEKHIVPNIGPQEVVADASSGSSSKKTENPKEKQPALVNVKPPIPDLNATDLKPDHLSHEYSHLRCSVLMRENLISHSQVVKQECSNLQSSPPKQECFPAQRPSVLIHEHSSQRVSVLKKDYSHALFSVSEEFPKRYSSNLKEESVSSKKCGGKLEISGHYLSGIKSEHSRPITVSAPEWISGSGDIKQDHTSIAAQEKPHSSVKSDKDLFHIVGVNINATSGVGSNPRNNTVISPPRDLSVVKYQPVSNTLSHCDPKASRQDIIVTAGRPKQSCQKSYSFSGGTIYSDGKVAVTKVDGHSALYRRNTDVVQNVYESGMSHLDKIESYSPEKANSNWYNQPSQGSNSARHQISLEGQTNSPRAPSEFGIHKDRNKSEERKTISNLRADHHELVSVYRDTLRANHNSSVRHGPLHQNLMHPAGISHSAAAAAAAVYPRVTALPQQNRNPGAPMPPAPLGSYSMSSHLLPPPHVVAANAAAATPPSSSQIEQQHATAMHPQAYRHLLSQHSMIQSQYGSNTSGNPAGMDMMWQQKYNPNPWVMAQYEEMRLERERAAIVHERERNRIERDRREDIERIERIDREKSEQEKLEKERHDREREREKHQKEQQQRHDRERLDREERERAQREAVQQHFEESLRLALQKQQQLQQKTMGWSPMSSLPLGKTQPGVGRSSPTVSLPQTAHSQSLLPSDHDRDKVRDKDKERISAVEARMRHEHDRWLAAVQRNEQVTSRASSHPISYPSLEGRTTNIQAKEVYPMPRSSPHTTPAGAHSSSKSNIVSSPSSSSSGSAPSQHKSETNFSLYGYQPFQHTYITHAQLKAREETKGSNSNMQQMVMPGNKQSNTGAIVKLEKEVIYENPSTPGNTRTNTPVGQGGSGKQQLKLMHQGVERASPMYQPLVGSGGAFKPYEFNSSSPAPPAHQSSSPTTSNRIGTPHYHHAQQEQPQNLVKVEHKTNSDPSMLSHNNQRYETRDIKQTVSTPPCTIPSNYSPSYSVSKSASPAASLNYSYSLIQQGLVPNPLYIAASHNAPNVTINTSATSSQIPSKISPHAGSPPITQHYSRASGSGITSGTPVCRSNSLSYSAQQARSVQRYSPVGPMSGQFVTLNSNKTVPQEAHVGSRSHIQIQGASHRSPSPAHISIAQPLVQPGVSGSPHSRNSSCLSPRINAAQSSPQVQIMHRMPFQTVANCVLPVSPPPQSGPLVDGQAVPLNLQGSISKRKCSKEINVKKRQKTSDEHLLPPQLHPQICSAISSPIKQMGTPPHLMSNTTVPSTGSLVMTVGGNLFQNTSVSSESPSRQLTTKLESSTPLAMPELVYTSGMPCSSRESRVDNAQCSSVNISHEGPALNVDHARLQSKDNGNLDADSSFRTTGNINSPSLNVHLTSTSGINSHDGCDDNRMTVSPASSASSTLTSCSSTGGSTNHTKLKKAWLQRHSENEDKKNPIDVTKVDFHTKPVQNEPSEETRNQLSESAVKIQGDSISDASDTKLNTSTMSSPVGEEHGTLKSEPAEEDSTSCASEMEEEIKHIKRKLRITQKQGASIANGKRQKIPGTSSELVEPSIQIKKDVAKKKSGPEKDTPVSSKRRGRKGKGRHVVPDESQRKISGDIPEKPSVAHLKKTGESFLQDGPCCEVAPRLPKCRECRMTPHQRSKKMPNIFCRFYAYRKLRYGKSGTILSAGFSEQSDATEEDLKLWLPPVETPPSDIEAETSKFLLTHVGDQFCDLVEMEKEAQAMHMSENATISWKRVVQGVREMCDVCETTLFNIHWVCHKCGFVVCIDCYRARKCGLGKGEDSLTKDRDEYQWLLCNNRQAHEQEKLTLTQIIASTALWDVGKTLHEVRRKWNIPTYCNCSIRDSEQDGKHSTNGICKLMSAVTKCFSSDKDTSQVNGLSESSRLGRKGNRNASVNGVVKQEDGMSGYSSESGGSPLSWLADVALNSSGKVKDENKKKDTTEEEDDDKLSDSQCDEADGFAESDDEKSENFSTLRELLIRPMGKMGSKNNGPDSSSQKTLTSTLDEVISCVIEQRVRKSDKKCKEKQLLHFTRRHQMLRSGRELLPIRSCMLTESSLLYPEIPHLWLGNGKILLLTDSYHSSNMQMFQEQWKRGQPVIVANVGQKLDESLWNPESFAHDFGDMKNDFFDCLSGTLVQSFSMKEFWEGFEDTSKRMEDDNGTPMILKLKDWPPSEEFSELLPARYQDLMRVLPLPQYTHRDGTFNMASRLPDCFVRPDLGPRMYSAYGLDLQSGKGSTNLHLDVSDAVNVLAYVGKPSDTREDISDADISKALDESGCDSQMKKRSQESGLEVGAIWHVYNARDADKIRDLLNKVAVEQGAKRDPHHDPIHNQECYLDKELRCRLYKEYGVEGYTIAQCLGDALFIPAGSPHQVKNIKSCVKISEDFVSPESVGHSFFLTQEIRHLSDGPSNPEDRLQIKNIIYHAVKDALALLQSCDPEDSKS